jgi:hypothetical protein
VSDHVGKTATIADKADLLPCGHPQADAHTCETIGILCHAACGTCQAAYLVTDQREDSIDIVGVAREDACPTVFHGFPVTEAADQ